MSIKQFLYALLLVTLLPLQGASAQSEDGAFLDPPYPKSAERKRRDNRPMFFNRNKAQSLTSPTAEVIAKQTPVRSQMARGTCAIFSTTALLESVMLSQSEKAQARWNTRTLDLSEEWLEYLAVRNRTEDGSWTWANVSHLKENGTVEETMLPYIGETWEELTSSPLAKERCGAFAKANKNNKRAVKGCLLAHWDPRLIDTALENLIDPDHQLYNVEFHKVRIAAEEFRGTYLNNLNSERSLGLSEARELLMQGEPVVVGLDFFYEAWNHRKAVELGLNRDEDNWSKGIVGYPEANGLDRKKSREKPAGHSVLLVGFDDNVEVTTKVKQADGTLKNYTYKGVYYFKNSWGAESFGRQFELNGKNYPGYGAITADYVQEYGDYYRFELR